MQASVLVYSKYKDINLAIFIFRVFFVSHLSAPSLILASEEWKEVCWGDVNVLTGYSLTLSYRVKFSIEVSSPDSGDESPPPSEPAGN